MLDQLDKRVHEVVCLNAAVFTTPMQNVDM